MSVKIDLNTNCLVLVRLTADGEETYLQHHARLGVEAAPLERNAEGWCEFLLWELMSIFGPKCAIGGRQQFVENCVRISGQQD